MSIFKKIFGKSGSKDENTKPDIEKLINSSDLNDSIIELDDYICQLCEYGDKLDILTQSQKNFFYNQNLEKEINNGGFNQFYFNSSGNFAHETIQSLNEIGANITSDILKKANDQFPNKQVPKDRTQRQIVLEQIEEQSKEVWEKLDQKFYEYEDDLNQLNIDYIKKNKEEF